MTCLNREAHDLPASSAVTPRLGQRAGSAPVVSAHLAASLQSVPPRWVRWLLIDILSSATPAVMLEYSPKGVAATDRAALLAAAPVRRIDGLGGGNGGVGRRAVVPHG